MAYEFKKLSDVEVAEEVTDSDEVLIVKDKTVKKISKNHVGTNITYFVMNEIPTSEVQDTSSGCLRKGKDWNLGETATISDVISAYNNGIARICISEGKYYSDVISCSFPEGCSFESFDEGTVFALFLKMDSLMPVFLI